MTIPIDQKTIDSIINSIDEVMSEIDKKLEKLDQKKVSPSPDSGALLDVGTLQFRIKRAKHFFIQANLEAFQKAKNDDERQAIFNDLTLIYELLSNPSDEIINRCYERADTIDDPASPFWVALGIALIIGAFVITLTPLFLLFLPPISSPVLLLGAAISMSLFSVSAFCFLASTGRAILKIELEPSERSSSMFTFTKSIEKTNSILTKFNIFSEKPENPPTSNIQETNLGSP